MRHFYTMAGVLAALSLVACTEKPSPPAAKPAQAAVPAAAKPGREQLQDQLMGAVFGTRYDSAKSEARHDFAASENVKPGTYRMQAVEHKTLASGETVLLVRARLPDDQGDLEGWQNGWLSLYFLRQEQGTWRVIGRRDDALYLDRAAILTAAWVSPGKGREGLAIEAWREWQEGCADGHLTLFDLTDARVRLLHESIATRSNASVDECNRSYDISRWSVESKWRFEAPKVPGAYDDLVLTFSGELASPADDEQGKPAGERIKAPVGGKARYAYDAKSEKYVLAEGRNLVPADPEDYDG